MSPDKRSGKGSLASYRKKRQAQTTPEPFGDGLESPGVFVVQKHAARRTHFDLRLELDGVLLSWAVPKGPSLDPEEKRLAVQTEDHPVEYADFEGRIPEGNYGAGAMIIWDRGRWLAVEEPRQGLEKGKLLFRLQGYKLGGLWTLVRTKQEKEWLLIKKPDAWSQSGQDGKLSEQSIFSGLTVEELADKTDKGAELEARLAKSRAPRGELKLQEVELMLAETSPRPFSRKGWIFELKYDGYRLLASRQGSRIQLRYRGGQDATRFFPELLRPLESIPVESFILDGEVVVADAQGRPDFQLLQSRAQRRGGEIAQSALQTSATLFAFDLIFLLGHDLRELPLLERKALLQFLLPEAGPVRYSEHLEERGAELYASVELMGLEGIVGKKADSPYQGGRSRHWQKVRADQTGDFVIVGFTKGRASRTGFGALHLGVFIEGRLTYCGRVGSGFTETQLKALRQRLDGLITPTPLCRGRLPAGSDHTWVRPEIVCRVRYKEATTSGQLRQARFEGLVPEKTPADCSWPEKISAETYSHRGPEEDPGGGSSSQAVASRFTNLNKVYWPDEGYTKGDLIDYYRRVGPWILPYLRDRPLVLDRYPAGIRGKSFFQKNPPDFVPGWIRTEHLRTEGETQGKNYFICDDLDSLLYLVNLGCIPLHIWASRVQSLDFPDWIVLDLDPKDAPFRHVVETAEAIRGLCRRLSIPSYLKTSGGEGLHCMVPLGARYTYKQARLLAELLARFIALELTDIATLERTVEAREGKVYIDYLQNGQGKLIAAPYCVRPRPKAPVSTPLTWEELEPGLDISRWTIKTVPDRLKTIPSEPFKEILEESLDLTHVIARLTESV